MRGRPSFPALVLLVSALAVAAPGAAQEPDVRTGVDTTRVTVGDPVTLTVSVLHHPDARVVWPDSLEVGPFEVLDVRVGEGSVRGDTARSDLIVNLAAYELGELEIPGFEVGVLGPEGKSTILTTSPWGILVESVGLDESGDIRELKGPVGLPLDPAVVALWALGLLLLALAGWLLVRRLRQGSDVEEAGREPAVPPRPAHETALEELACLEASRLLERGEVKEYHIRLSEIIRRYLEGRFRVWALEMTTRDILAGLKSRGLEEPIRERLRAFLDRCDLVKFAKHRPETEASREALVMGRDLVKDTIPELEPTERGNTDAPMPATTDAPAPQAADGRTLRAKDGTGVQGGRREETP